MLSSPIDSPEIVRSKNGLRQLMTRTAGTAIPIEKTTTVLATRHQCVKYLE